ncbi:proline-rich protein 2-like [Pyrgilauda ruficollis]|uniref:proline-rich protein 2-like n=1 Tax=Pyrgilauda ruficollis TaxID=221976 RepID=UPI001B8849DF|nr:proline-rich protein 2-like [Pyrgilauda ruficollis]
MRRDTGGPRRGHGVTRAGRRAPTAGARGVPKEAGAAARGHQGTPGDIRGQREDKHRRPSRRPLPVQALARNPPVAPAQSGRGAGRAARGERGAPGAPGTGGTGSTGGTGHGVCGQGHTRVRWRVPGACTRVCGAGAEAARSAAGRRPRRNRPPKPPRKAGEKGNGGGGGGAAATPGGGGPPTAPGGTPGASRDSEEGGTDPCGTPEPQPPSCALSGKRPLFLPPPPKNGMAAPPPSTPGTRRPRSRCPRGFRPRSLPAALRRVPPLPPRSGAAVPPVPAVPGTPKPRGTGGPVPALPLRAPRRPGARIRSAPRQNREPPRTAEPHRDGSPAPAPSRSPQPPLPREAPGVAPPPVTPHFGGAAAERGQRQSAPPRATVTVTPQGPAGDSDSRRSRGSLDARPRPPRGLPKPCRDPRDQPPVLPGTPGNPSGPPRPPGTTETPGNPPGPPGTPQDSPERPGPPGHPETPAQAPPPTS